MRISDWSSDVCSSDLPQLEGWIQRDFAVELFKDAGLDFETLKKQARSRDFRPVELEGGTFSAKYDVDSEVITSYNIVGRIEGSQRPDETVIYRGHWAPLGVGAPDAEGDRLYNGAVDHATGTAALVAMGRAFANADTKPRGPHGFEFGTTACGKGR